MIGHERELERIDIEEAEGGKKPAQKHEHGRQRPAAESITLPPGQGGGGGDREWKQPLPRLPCVDRPAVVKEGQRVRPGELGSIEARGTAGDQQPVGR